MKFEQEIKNFITTKENNGAFLITGKWGCGKTFLIKSIIDNYNDNDEYLLSLVSLFGIDSIDNVHSAIKEAVFFSRGFEKNSNVIKENFKKLKQVTQPLLDTFGEVSKVVKGVNTAINLNWQDFFPIDNEIECLHNGKIIKKKLVLILDDFERSKLNRIELMGAINDYCENKNIKVILVADEDRINNEESEANKEFKEYKEFKEKLISRTIRFIPDYGNIIDSIIRNYKETEIGYCNFLRRNIELIIELFGESETENFRSLKSLFLDFERVFALWCKFDFSIGVLPKVFYNYGAILFMVKSGEYQEGPYGDLLNEDKITKKFKNWDSDNKLSSLKNWALSGIWDEEDFIAEIKRKYESKEMSDDEKFLRFYFWGLDQKIISNGMPIVLSRAYEGELNRNDLIDLFHKIYVMNEYGVEIPCEVDYKRIYDGFEIRRKKILDSQVEEPNLRRSAFKENIPEKCLELYDSITKFDDYLAAFNNKKKVYDYLKPDSKVSEYSLGRLIVGVFDEELMNNVWVAFLGADNSKKREIIRVIINLGYKDKFYSTSLDMKGSIDNFNILKNRLVEYKNTVSDSITMAIVNESIKCIEGLCREIKNAMESYKK